MDTVVTRSLWDRMRQQAMEVLTEDEKKKLAEDKPPPPSNSRWSQEWNTPWSGTRKGDEQ